MEIERKGRGIENVTANQGRAMAQDNIGVELPQRDSDVPGIHVLRP